MSAQPLHDVTPAHRPAAPLTGDHSGAEGRQAAQTDGEAVRAGDQTLLLQDSLAGAHVTGGLQDTADPGTTGLLVERRHHNTLRHWEGRLCS